METEDDIDPDERAFAAFDELADELVGPLLTDAEWSRARASDAMNTATPEEEFDIHMWRRVYVRAALAAVEATVTLAKRFVFTAISARNPLWASRDAFDDAELALLRNEEYRLDQSGRASAVEARLRFLDNFKFVAKCMAKLVGAAGVTALGGTGMEALRTAVAVRDRLTHPRRPEDLRVSDAELNAVDRSLSFWNEIEEEIDMQISRKPYLDE